MHTTLAIVSGLFVYTYLLICVCNNMNILFHNPKGKYQNTVIFGLYAYVIEVVS